MTLTPLQTKILQTLNHGFPCGLDTIYSQCIVETPKDRQQCDTTLNNLIEHGLISPKMCRLTGTLITLLRYYITDAGREALNQQIVEVPA